MGAVQQACCGNFRNNVQKIVKGVLIINIHKTQPGVPLKKIEDKQNLQPLIKQSLISLQEKSNIFIPHTQELSPEEIDKIHKGEGGICGGKYKISSKHNTISPQNIEFTKFKVNTENYPYIAYFELGVDMLEGDHIFCENLEKQCYEIFDESEKLGEISYISSFWFVGEKNYQAQAVQIGGGQKKGGGPENFITDAEEQQQLNQNNKNQQSNLTPNDKNLQQQFNQIPETFEEDGIPSLEIALPYYQQNYKKILNIYESESIALDLFYDQEKDKLLSVKIFKNQFSHIDSTNVLIENEKKRVINAIRNTHLPIQERFMDKYDDEIKTLKRNIVREIMISYLCNDFNLNGINKLEGVIVGDKNIMIAYDFFGDTEIQSQQLTCDLGSYFSKNVQSYFQHKNYDQTQKILQEILFSIMQIVDELHQQGIFMRELQPQDILVRRRFNPVQPQQSIYEVCLVNFGKSKRIPVEQNDPYNKSNQHKLKNDHSVKILNKPQQLFGKDSNQNKNFIDFKRDDIFQLGILLYKLFLILGLEQQIDEQNKENLQRMTGLPFKLMIEFYEIMSKVKQLFKGGLEEAMKYEENIQDLQQIKAMWSLKSENFQSKEQKQASQLQQQYQQQEEKLQSELE